MRNNVILGLALSLAGNCFPQHEPAAQPAKTDAAIAHIEQLKTKAERKGEADRARLYADIAHELVELANTQFISGDPEKGQASIKNAVTFAEKAAASAEEKGHKIKNAEITLRETARRIDEVRKSLEVDDQPPLKQAVERLGELRNKLLQRMFGKDKK